MKSTVCTYFLCSAVFLLALGCNNDRVIPGLRNNTGGAGGGFTPVSICSEPTAPDGCGEACNRDGDCMMGTHCTSNFCDALCDDSGGCDAQSVCSDRGRCDRLLPEGGTGGTMGCIDDEVTPTRIEPNVMFLVDKSGSMQWLLDGTLAPGFDGYSPTNGYTQRRAAGERNRWEIAHDAIASVLGDLDSLVQFGLSTFGSEPMCPSVPIIPISANNASTILASYLYTTVPNGSTPTPQGVSTVATHLAGSPGGGDGPTILVLATDGEPNGCSGSGQTQTQVVNNVEAAFNDVGFETFVLSVGRNISEAHLQEVANVGLGLNRNGSEGNAMFWVGDQADELEAAFRAIVNAQITCDLNLNGVVQDLSRVCEGDIRLDGVALDCGTDWRLKPGTNDTIELLGNACTQWRMGDANITAVFPCGILQTN